MGFVHFSSEICFSKDYVGFSSSICYNYLHFFFALTGEFLVVLFNSK